MRHFAVLAATAGLLFALAIGLTQAQLGGGIVEPGPAPETDPVFLASEAASVETNWILLVDCDDWGGEETGEGSLNSSNAVVWTGYSTANATNNANAGDAWFSAETDLQDLYFYQTVSFPADMVRLVGLKLLVRSSSNNSANNYVTLLLDDGVNAASTATKLSASADVWAGHDATVNAAWTNTAPSITRGGLTLKALNARIDAFVKSSNKIQAQLWGQVICE